LVLQRKGEDGEKRQNAFGINPQFEDCGLMRRAILGIIGIQEVLVSGLVPVLDFDVIGSSGVYTVIDSKNSILIVGDEVTFKVNYGALLSIMTSPFVHKK
jgi:ornithine racemase